MKQKIITAIIIVGAIICAYYLFLDQYVSVSELRAALSGLVEYYRAYPTATMLIFSMLFIILTVLSIPATAILTLTAGALFGLIPGIILTLISATAGAILSFLIARHFFGESIQKKYKCQLDGINEGIKNEGNYYLFSLRVMPVLPFCVINILMGLTKMRLWDYTLMTVTGITSWVVIYVYAGTMLRRIRSFDDIISYEMATALILLGIFPIAVKKLLSFIQKKKIAG